MSLRSLDQKVSQALGKGGYSWRNPYYSTNITAAWEIVQHIKPLEFKLEQLLNGFWVCELRWLDPASDKIIESASWNSGGPAESIVRAYLLGREHK